MAVKSENTQNEIESTRSDSIGCSEAYKEFQETTSVELLRNSIFRSISKLQTIPKIPVQEQSKSSYSRRKAKSDLSLSNIEVKFLEKFSSMDSRLQLQSTNKNDTNQLPTQPPSARQIDAKQQNSENTDQDMRNYKILHETHSSNTQKSTQLSDSKEDAKENSETDGSGKNSLKLVFRTSNNTIFEDCSTYNINCNEVFGPKTSNGFRKGYNSPDSGSQIPFYDREKLLGDGFYIVEPDDRSPDRQSEVSEDLPSLCDTFFSKVNSGDYAPIISNNSMQKTTNKKLTAAIKPPENKAIAAAKDEEVKQQEDAVDGGRNVISKISRRIRKRNRKSQSNEPHVYECPQCGVSYTISTDMVNDAACCLHCDLWTSVEPEFLKREKQPWNTCRIC